MYCSNCGKKVDEKAVICVNCGVALNNKFVQPTLGVKKGNRGIASMVLGIIAVFLSVCMFSNFDQLGTVNYYIEYGSNSEFAIETVIIPMILAIVGISLACVSRKNEKNGYNTSGLWLAIATFVLSAIQYIYIITY